MRKINIERILEAFMLAGISFFCGVFFTFYTIDQRLWNENINKANDIETRALNFPQKSCYNWQDIELIIFGEIQE